MEVILKNNFINPTRPFLSVSHTNLGNYCLCDQILEPFYLESYWCSNKHGINETQRTVSTMSYFTIVVFIPVFLLFLRYFLINLNLGWMGEWLKHNEVAYIFNNVLLYVAIGLALLQRPFIVGNAKKIWKLSMF